MRNTLSKTSKTVKTAGMAPKFMSPSLAGMPDRLVLLPKGKMAFVEIKSTGMKPSTTQKTHAEAFRFKFMCWIMENR